jgi:hypothetical protein
MSEAVFLRAGQDGAVVAGTPGHVLTMQSDGKVKAEAQAGGVPSSLRADWAFATSIIFSANASSGDIQADGVDTFDGVELGDTIFVPPALALGPPFHSGPAAPQFGGLYVVLLVIDTTHLNVARAETLNTEALVDATALVSAVGGDAAGLFQIATPAGAVLDTDPQVMPMIGKPAPAISDTFALQCTNGLLAWVAVTP